MDQKDIDQVISHIKSAESILKPYMETITNEERHDLAKMSDKTIAFVQKTVNYCEANVEFVPSYLDVAEMKKDLKLVTDLKKILDASAQMLRLVEDTSMLAGSEAYLAALMYYGNVKTAVKHGAQNAAPIYEDLGTRFPGRKGKKKEEPADNKKS